MLRLLSYNIRFGGSGRESALAETIRSTSPDLVVLQEATRPSVVQRLAADAGMEYWASTPRTSVAFMSRLPVSHAWHRPRGCRHAYLELVLPESEARVFGVHLSAINSNWAEQRRARELDGLLKSIERHQHGPHVLAGDFNTLAPGERLEWRRLPWRLRVVAFIGGRTIRWQTVQMMLDAGYRDGFRLLHPDDPGHTFPTWDPHVRLDYVFVRGTAAEGLKRCEVVNGERTRDASDHLPLLAELEL